MAAGNNFTSPAADALYGSAIDVKYVGGLLQQLVNGTSGWTVALTVFLMLVVYDQCQ
jgi:hypothetical protein